MSLHMIMQLEATHFRTFQLLPLIIINLVDNYGDGNNARATWHKILKFYVVTDLKYMKHYYIF
jgi:hypothetical protein